MKEIKAIIQPFMVNHVLHALHRIPDLPAVTVSEVRAIDTSSGRFEQVVKSKLEIMVPDEKANEVLHTIQAHAHTGKPGDGRVFIIPIEASVSVRTGQAQSIALGETESGAPNLGRGSSDFSHETSEDVTTQGE